MSTEIAPMPCPFCGRAPQVSSRVSTHTQTGEHHSISCFGGGCSSHAYMHGDSAAVALAQWNARHVTEAQP